MDTTAPVPAEQSSAGDQIERFWIEHGEALTDPANPNQQRLNEELTRLYHQKTGEPLPASEQPAESLVDYAENPVTDPAAFDIGPQSHFGMNVGPHDGWDEQTEQQARNFMASAGLSQSSALVVANAYTELSQGYYKPERAAQQSQDLIGKAYPNEADAAVSAMRRVILEAGGESLKEWLNDTGLGNHPLVVREVLSLAERKGYISRKGS
jgi:hypothetical protein